MSIHFFKLCHPHHSQLAAESLRPLGPLAEAFVKSWSACCHLKLFRRYLEFR